MPKKLKTSTVTMIALSDWNDLVTATYGRPYHFQQQDGCQPRGLFSFSVPIPAEDCSDYENDTVEEVVNGERMGVSFAAWLKRDPKAPLMREGGDRAEEWLIELFWHRHFYPDITMVINDLHTKGLIDEGEYSINIDW